MNKTILEISRDLGCTKAALQKRLARDPLKTAIDKHVSIEKGTKYVSPDGQMLIIEAFTNPQMDMGIPSGIDKGTPVHTDKSTPMSTDEIYNFLKKQIEQKDAEIEHKNAEIDALLKQNDQQQQLQAQLLNSIKLLESPAPQKKWFWQK